MFIGHFGLGFGAKKAAPAISLGILFMAVQFLDLLWPTLLVLNLEHAVIKQGTNNSQPIAFTDYPISHSLLLVMLWAFLFGFVYWLFKKNIRSAIIIALCVMSHWFLDLIVHLPDLPLYPGNSPMLGLKLWNSFIGTLLVEGSIFITGVVLYLRTTVAKNPKGNIGLWVLIALLVISYTANIFGPAPADMNAVEWAGQLQWIFVILAFWVDRNRTINSSTVYKS
jgi:membrane-bound metal-dependent hydrolase YbcI (DUF457 family)